MNYINNIKLIQIEVKGKLETACQGDLTNPVTGEIIHVITTGKTLIEGFDNLAKNLTKLVFRTLDWALKNMPCIAVNFDLVQFAVNIHMQRTNLK